MKLGVKRKHGAYLTNKRGSMLETCLNEELYVN
jgi:hypothetical protein